MTENGPAIMPVMQNAVAEMDLDIIIDDAPDHVTLQHEAFEQLTQLAQAGIPVPPEMIIENSSVRNKAELLEAMEQQKQQAMMMQQGQMQIEQAKVQAEVGKTQAEIGETQSDTELNKAQAFKTFIEAQRAAAGF